MSARREEGPLHASFGLGRVAGVEIGVNWSWIVVVGLVVWSLGAVVFPDEVPGLSDGAYVAMAIVAALLFFTSLLLHELGHAVVARREEGVVLDVFGLGRINLILLAFNMLPALPLDGGRVLRALLWIRSGDFMRATRTAGALGRAFGNGLMILGVFAVFAGGPGGLWLIAIGFFVSAAAQAEVSFATMRTALSGLTVRDAMVPEPESVSADLTLAAFVSGPFARSRHAAYPVVRDGMPVGLLSYRDVARVPPATWEQVRTGDVVRSGDDEIALAPGDDLAEALMQLSETPLQRALVLEGNRLAGLLSITDVSRLLELQSAQLSGFPRSGSGVSTVSAQGVRP